MPFKIHTIIPLLKLMKLRNSPRIILLVSDRILIRNSSLVDYKITILFSTMKVSEVSERYPLGGEMYQDWIFICPSLMSLQLYLRCENGFHMLVSSTWCLLLPNSLITKPGFLLQEFGNDFLRLSEVFHLCFPLYPSHFSNEAFIIRHQSYCLLTCVPH